MVCGREEVAVIIVITQEEGKLNRNRTKDEGNKEKDAFVSSDTRVSNEGGVCNVGRESDLAVEVVRLALQILSRLT